MEPPTGGHGLTEKAGPLPVWGWGVILGGVVVAYMILHRSSAAAPPVVTSSAIDPTTGLPTNDAGLWTGNNSGAGGGGSSVTPATPTPDPNAGNNPYTPPDPNAVDPNADPNAAPAWFQAYLGSLPDPTLTDPTLLDPPAPAPVTHSTDRSWEAKAVAYMAGRGHSPIAISNAISAYLNGKPLSAYQQTQIDTILKHQGMAPGVKAGAYIHRAPVKHVAPHVAAVAHPHTHIVHIVSGMSTVALVKKYYGSASAANIAKFHKANGMGKSSKLHAGQTVKVPVKK